MKNLWKGGRPMKRKDNERKAATLLLDGKTLRLLKEYSFEKLGETNMSKAVMLMAKEYDERRRQNNSGMAMGTD